MTIENEGADASMSSADAQPTQSDQGADAPKSVDYAEFQKVVEQRQAEKRARRELEGRLQAIEREKAEEQGKYKELYETQKSQYDSLYGNWLKDKVQSNVSRALDKAGCVDVELALGAGRSELLEFDEATGQVDGVEAWLQDLRERKPVLFQGMKQPTINPATPGGGLKSTASIPKEDISKLSKEEIIARLKQIN